MGSMLLLALVLSVPPQEDPKPLAGEIAAGLQKTAKRGNFAFQGELKTEVDPDDADEEPTVCAVSGGVVPGTLMVAEIKGDKSIHELAVKRGRLAGRETWKDHPLDLVNAPCELMSLLDFERLAVYVKDASSVKVLPDEKIGGEECAVYDLTIPKAAIRSYHDNAETAEEEEKSVRGVDLRLRVQKSDGTVVRLEAAVRRLYKDDSQPGPGTRGLSRFRLSLKDFGTAEVAPAPGFEKLLKD
ncbi:MAG TPA: hypothetical protein VE981_20520 [Planctomycetota bacterium]|nr:hypothetical protein [Planctomycetota bacterium]